MRISDFDYDLPDELIAQHPLERRDASRMLVVTRSAGTFAGDKFASLPGYLRAGDCLVLNNTKVFPARLVGERTPTGGTVEILLLRETGAGVWQVLARPARRLRPGERVSFGDGRLQATVTAAYDDGSREIRFDGVESLWAGIEEIGKAPLPPYIKRLDQSVPEDRERYQTIYARERGAIAAPTAGLHFTSQVFDQIREAGVAVAEITLHVGYGTFEPVRVEEVSRHHVLPETFSIDSRAADVINATRASGGRVVAVGTTTTRALESAVGSDNKVTPTTGTANLTIVPGYGFRIVDALLTNFHLPKSSLLLLVSAFAGRELTLEAYRHAVRERYRFYSYGDCMLIF